MISNESHLYRYSVGRYTGNQPLQKSLENEEETE